MSRQQQIQEDAYAFPYHYIPRWENGRFVQHCHWWWGFRYLGGIQVVLDELKKIGLRSLVDIGCGDGRFLREAALRFPDAELLGVDYSWQAIHLAQAMNPHLAYQACDILSEQLPHRFDVATLIEVLEHIPVKDVPAFVAATASQIKDGGWLIMTVPHSNMPVEAKHFQHFDSARLRQVLEPHFQDLRFVPFDALRRKAPMLALLERLIGGRGRYWLITNRHLLTAFFRLYQRRYLYCEDEASCGRIAVVCRKKI